MRLRQCQRPRATSRIWLSVCWGLLSGAALAVDNGDAAAATLGAFEVRLSDMRAPEGHEQIEYALADNGVPIVMTDRVGDKDADGKDADGKDVAADGGSKPVEPAGSETVQDDPKKPIIDAGDDDTPAPARGATAAKPASAAKIVVPKGGVGYYDGRAAEVLKAEMQRASTGTSLSYEAGTNVVVCVGGCSGGHMGVVFVQAKEATAQSGEMQQSSASGAEAPAAPRQDEIACIAGCYGDAPRSHPALTPERTQHDLQDAIDRAGSGARQSSAKPADDWQTAPKAKSLRTSRLARATVSRARASEKPGAWFTRIIKSREPETSEPEKAETGKVVPEKAEPEKQ